MYTGLKLVFNAGGSKTKLAISADGESFVDTAIIPTLQSPDEWVRTTTEKVKEMAGENKIGAVAGGIAGVWDEKKTRLIRSPNLPEWEKYPIKKNLEAAFAGVKVVLDNDVVMEGLGEATVGAGRRKKIVAFVAIGTGIGGVKIEDGKVCGTQFGFEPGHQIIDTDGTLGYFEDFAGGAGIKRIYGKNGEDITDPQVWENETRLLAIGLHNIVVLWSPEMLILGGSVMKSIDLQQLTEVMKKQLQIFPALPEIVRGTLEEKAGLYGALQYLTTGGGSGRS